MSATDGSDASGERLVTLPNSVLTTILEWIVKLSNPGQVIKLAVTCRGLFRSIAEAEGLWEALSISHGWSCAPSGPRAPPPPPPLEVEVDVPGRPLPAALLFRDLDRRWFTYYSRRMASRRNLRRFMRLYTSFMSRPSSMALMPGAEPSALAACERRLGVPLPWEVWELYRFRGGQAAGGPSVVFADDMRLLTLDEVCLEHHPTLPELRHRLALMGQMPQPALVRPALAHTPHTNTGIINTDTDTDTGTRTDPDPAWGNPPGLAPAGPAGGSSRGGGAPPREGTRTAPTAGAAQGGGGDDGDDDGGDEDDRLLVVASNPSCSRRLMVALNGQVYLARGLSVTFFAPSVAAMVQKLLS